MRLHSRQILSLFLPFACLLTSGAAAAQVAVYAMGSGGFIGSPTAPVPAGASSGTSAYGGTFGLYDDFVRLGPLKLGADARYFQQTKSNSNGYPNTSLHGGTGGVRLALKIPLFPLKPYIQAEAGAATTNYGYFGNDVGSFIYQIQGGVDYTIFPHLDLRAEYGGGQINVMFTQGAKQSLQEVGLGAVLRF